MSQVQNTIRLRAPFYPVKRAIADALCLPIVGKLISAAFHNRIPSRGCKISTDNTAILPSAKAALFWGIYESAEIRFVRKYLRPDLDVVELGSSVGVVTAQILKKLQAGRRLVCVEANPQLLSTLKQNTVENSDAKTVNVVHAAIVNSALDNQQSKLVLGSDHTGSHVESKQDSSPTIEVPGLTLSTILRDCSIEDEFVLVSDIEGAEVNFIENDSGALAKCRQLIIELHETNWKSQIVSVDQLRSALESSHGFNLIANRGPVCVFEK